MVFGAGVLDDDLVAGSRPHATISGGVNDQAESGGFCLRTEFSLQHRERVADKKTVTRVGFEPTPGLP